jgi:ribosomal 30S subunit maturation factor RimM
LVDAGQGAYVVQGATKEFLIPAVKEIIEKVDFAATGDHQSA